MLTPQEIDALELFKTHSKNDKLTFPSFIDIILPPSLKSSLNLNINLNAYNLLFYVISGKKEVITEDDWMNYSRKSLSNQYEFKVLFDYFSEGEQTINLLKFAEKLAQLTQFGDSSINKTNDGSTTLVTNNFNWLKLADLNNTGELNYYEFVTFLNYLPDMKSIENFKIFSTLNNTNTLTKLQFESILINNYNHKLSPSFVKILDYLPVFYHKDEYNYANLLLMLSTLNKFDLFNQLINRYNDDNNLKYITKDDLVKYINNPTNKFNNFNLITQQELNLLFFITKLNSQSNNELYLTYQDFNSILNNNHSINTHFEEKKSFWWPIAENVYSFVLGSVAGCIGATVVYPIDLVKTRMQAQKNLSMYKNSLDCFSKVLAKEGVRGLYSGLAAQLVGVAPEKAIKLTVNDIVRKFGTDPKTKQITMSWEILAGMCAGGCQVVFTNPLEIVKIRLQMQGTAAVKKSASTIIKELGIRGLYKGATACMMRDIPFSAIYFPTYANLKRILFKYDPADPNSKLTTVQLLISGSLAGAPAAYCTTPFDVVKTRLQVESSSASVHYNTIPSAIKNIYKYEGAKAFLKGGVARVCRSSPQFGCTLATYELFKNYLSLDKIIERKPEVDYHHVNYFNKSKDLVSSMLDLDYSLNGFDADKFRK